MIDYAKMDQDKALSLRFSEKYYDFTPVESTALPGKCYAVACLHCGKRYDWRQGKRQRDHQRREHGINGLFERNR